MINMRRLLLFGMLSVFCFYYPGYGVSMATDKDMAKKEIKEKKTLIFWNNIRLRYEIQDNFNVKNYGSNPAQGKSDDGFLLGRLRFGLHYNPNEIIHISVGIQHSEQWDCEMKESDFYKSNFDSPHNPYEDSWEPFDTYIEIKNLLPFSIKAGRQTIAYGNNRIYGSGNWGNTGRWQWDAVKLHYTFERGFLDAYYGGTMLHDPSHLSWKRKSGFKSFGAYSQYKLPRNLLGLVIEPFSMTKKNDRNRCKSEDGKVGDFDSYYFGARIFKKDFKGFDFDATFIKQEGERSNDDIDAFGYHCLLAYRFKQIGLKPRISLEYTYASGDSDPKDGKLKTFDGPFGARATIMGRMNLFHWMNIKDAQINAEFKPKKTLSFTVGFHQFWLAEDKDAWYPNKTYKDTTGNSGDKVGKEFDLIVKWTLSKEYEIMFGYGHFWPGEFAKNMASDKDANWLFLQWVYKFKHPVL